MSLFKYISRALALLVFAIVLPAQAASVLEQIGEFTVPEANQGIGVDRNHFYAVDNTAIAKYDKRTGQQIVDLLFAGHSKRGTTLVLVTHDNALAQRCGRVVRLRSGRVDSVSTT